MRKLIRLMLLTAFGTPTVCSADWILDNDASTLSFTSTKAGTVAEVHTFGGLAGSIGPDGEASLLIDLDSVDTAIGIRDERMRELLFETSEYAVATVALTLAPDQLDGLAPGQRESAAVEAELQLHGVARPLTAQVSVARLGEERLLVATEVPLIINADDVGLAEGVERLRAIAGLSSISPAVPVTFVLVFERSLGSSLQNR